eukprot:comp12843_c0_seq1/m.8008 comp12843_c0_seq1/g.8008  ORF comp12843_c0_seq1/g.8008 comp12843_c0_seq1/m.8008 type:complete len:126 (-) comp12843_c0_seq1:291-668(-)
MAEAMLGVPVRTKQAAYVIGGIHTELLLCAYSDRLLVLVTQLLKVGTLLAASAQAGLDGRAPTYSVSTLLGRRDDPVYPVYARTLMAAIAQGGEQRPLLLGLGLKDESSATLRTIVDLVLENKVW